MIFALIILGLLVLWFISVQRRLVSMDEKCMNSMSQIGVQQNSRWDAIGALAELTKSYNEHEYKTLRDVIAQRREISSNSSSADASSQEDLIGSAISRIRLVAEQYPELKANTNYLKIMDSVNEYENNVRLSRMVYNDSVTKYNRMVRQAPDSIVASLLRFSVREYLKDPEGKTEMPSLNL